MFFLFSGALEVKEKPPTCSLFRVSSKKQEYTSINCHHVEGKCLHVTVYALVIILLDRGKVKH